MILHSVKLITLTHLLFVCKSYLNSNHNMMQDSDLNYIQTYIQHQFGQDRSQFIQQIHRLERPNKYTQIIQESKPLDTVYRRSIDIVYRVLYDGPTVYEVVIRLHQYDGQWNHAIFRDIVSSQQLNGQTQFFISTVVPHLMNVPLRTGKITSQVQAYNPINRNSHIEMENYLNYNMYYSKFRRPQTPQQQIAMNRSKYSQDEPSSVYLLETNQKYQQELNKQSKRIGQLEMKIKEVNNRVLDGVVKDRVRMYDDYLVNKKQSKMEQDIQNLIDTIQKHQNYMQVLAYNIGQKLDIAKLEDNIIYNTGYFVNRNIKQYKTIKQQKYVDNQWIKFIGQLGSSQLMTTDDFQQLERINDVVIINYDSIYKFNKTLQSEQIQKIKKQEFGQNNRSQNKIEFIMNRMHDNNGSQTDHKVVVEFDIDSQQFGIKKYQENVYNRAQQSQFKNFQLSCQLDKMEKKDWDQKQIKRYLVNNVYQIDEFKSIKNDIYPIYPQVELVIQKNKKINRSDPKNYHLMIDVIKNMTTISSDLVSSVNQGQLNNEVFIQTWVSDMDEQQEQTMAMNVKMIMDRLQDYYKLISN